MASSQTLSFFMCLGNCCFWHCHRARIRIGYLEKWTGSGCSSSCNWRERCHVELFFDLLLLPLGRQAEERSVDEPAVCSPGSMPAFSNCSGVKSHESGERPSAVSCRSAHSVELQRNCTHGAPCYNFATQHSGGWLTFFVRILGSCLSVFATWAQRLWMCVGSCL